MARRRFSAAQLRAQRAFAARYGNKARAVKKVKPRMAGRTKKAYAAARRGAGRAGIRLGPIAGGAGAALGARYMGAWGAPVGSFAAGTLLKDDFSRNMGLYQAGAMLAGMVPLPGGGSGPSGGLL